MVISNEKALMLHGFFGNKCSIDNNITYNSFVGQYSIDIMGTNIDLEGAAYGNSIEDNAFCQNENGCSQDILIKQKFSNSLFWQHEYNIIYEPGESRQVLGAEFASNLASDWDSRPMEFIDGYYYIGFDNPNQGERIFNIKYNVAGVSYDYYAISTQGLAGEVYINGMLLDCSYTYYFPVYSANFKAMINGNGSFSNPGADRRLQGCDQLCSQDRLSQRVSWTDAGELSVPGGVFTGNCYVNGTLQFDCPVAGKDAKVSGAFDWWAAIIGFTMQDDRSGISAPMKTAYISSEPWRLEDGVTIFYPEGSYAYWLDVNPCHPDVILEGSAHHVNIPSS